MEESGATDEALDQGLQALLQGPVRGALKPHPATGWMAVEIVPGSKILPPMEDAGPQSVQTPFGTLQIDPSTMNVEDRVGVVAAKVVEVGPTPGIEFPWGSGDKVFIGSDRGIQVGDYLFVMVDKPICYTKAEED